MMKRPLLKDKAYSAIKNRIQDATFAPGAFLSERQLATLLGMSKTPVKAALERLELEGFVFISPQQGIAVCELSIKEVAEQFELRKALETFVVNAIAGQLNQQQLDLIDCNLVQQSSAASNSDVERLVELDTEFHLLLCELFGNSAIKDCMLQHRSKMHRVIRQVMANGVGRLTEAVKEHKGIYAAIKSGNSARAVALMEKHLEYGKRYLLSSKWT